MAQQKELLLPQLKPESYDNWFFRIKCILEERGLGNVLSLQQLDEKSRPMDAKAKSVIVQCLTDRHLNLVKECTSAREMIQVLNNTFQRKSIISKITLRRKLIQLKHDATQTLEEYFEKFDNIVRDLEVAGDNIPETDKICYLMTGLGEEYNHIITAIETINAEIKLEFVKAKLLDHEIKKKSTETESEPQSSFISCYKCHKRGHRSFECRSRGRGRGQGYKGPRTRGAAYPTVNKNPMFLASDQALFGDVQDGNITFVVDSGATQHFIQEKYEKHLVDVTNLNTKLEIKIANGQILKATKQGYLDAYYKNEGLRLHVIIVPGLSNNLISVSKLVENKKKVIFNNNKLIIVAPNKKVYYGEKKGLLYTLNLKVNSEETCNITETEDLWHRRMGHMCRKNMAIMRLPYSKIPCEICIKNKSTRLPFKRLQGPRSSKVGDLIHTDISGPSRQPTKEGYRYFQTIIDDYSHFTQTYLLKNKYEATEKLINFIKEIERQEEIKIKRIRCDNGGEFTAGKLKQFCQEKGITIEYTQSYSPQQNGKAERMNRTIYDKARTMLDESNLPRWLWGQAVLTATFLINRSPCSAIGNKIPVQIRKKQFNLDKIKIFGCKAWAHIIPKRDKFSSRARECRMVGYSTNGYTLWDINSEQIIVSRDVRFDESITKYEEYKNKYQKQTKMTYKIVQDENQSEEEHQSENDENDDDEKYYETTELQKTTKSGREVRKPKRFEEEIYEAYCLMSSVNDPATYKEAIKQSSDWQTAINKEIKSLTDKETWIETELPKNTKPIDTKWVFRTKSDGSKKARLVARGFQQQTEDFVYSPVAKMTTIRLGLSQALYNNWEIIQLDIPTAFLNGKIEKEVYITVPEGVKVKNQKGETVLKLQKALYGLKESPKYWNKRFNEFCTRINLKRSENDICLYKGNEVWLILFVDDILLMGNQENVKKITKLLEEEFEAKNLGKIKKYLGLEIHRDKNTMKLSQKQFILNLLKKYNMSNCKEMKTPMEHNFQVPENEEIFNNVPYRELIGSLNYLSTISRPDITFATSYLSRYLEKPTQTTWTAAKRILHYLKGTVDKQLTYKKREDANIPSISAFSDADWASNKTDRKSVSGMLIYHRGNLISWSSKKQQSVSLSTAESEYVSAATCISEMLFVQGLTIDFKEKCEQCVIYVDNQSAIKMIMNSENTRYTKHIDIKYHFVKDIGQIHTTGSPIEIKRTLGSGYKLTVYLPERQPDWQYSSEEKAKEILALVRDVIKNASVVDVSNGQIEINLPFYDVDGVSNNFVQVCSALEEGQARVGFRNFELDCSTLEQVFFDICARADSQEHTHVTVDKVPSKSASNSSVRSSEDSLALVGAGGARRGSRLQQFTALLKARLLHHVRNKWLLFMLIVLPTTFVTLAMAFSTIRPPPDNEISLKLAEDLYAGSTEYIVSKPSIYSESIDPTFAGRVMEQLTLDKPLRNWTDVDTPTCKCMVTRMECQYSERPAAGPQLVSLPDASTLNTWLVNSHGAYIEKRYGGFTSTLANNKTTIIAWYNNKGYHALPSFLSGASNAALRAAAGAHRSITTYSHPLKISKEQISKTTVYQHVADAGISILVLVAFSLISAGGAVYLVSARARQEKRLQLLCGVSPALYWGAALVWDLMIICINIAITATLMWAFGFPVFVERDNLSGICLLMFLYGFACGNMVHCCEKLFHEASLANMLLFTGNAFLGLTGIVLLLILDIISESEATDNARRILHKVFMLSPQFALGDGMLEIAKNTIQGQVLHRFGMDTYRSPLHTSIVALHYTYLVVVGVAFGALNLAIEYGYLQWILDRLTPHGVYAACGERLTAEPSDVAAERRAAAAPDPPRPLALPTIGNINRGFVHAEGKNNSMTRAVVAGRAAACVGLGKAYGTRVAVRALSLTIPQGKCTALLGENGAGKSSTFAMVTGAVQPTRGHVRLSAAGSRTSRHLARGLVSYCPQSNAIDPLLTVRETLELYCQLRGISEPQQVIDRTLEMFDIARYARVRCGALSGGNQRKLCTALAFMGRAPLVLLDEPTSGMDPVSRRVVSSGAARAAAAGRAVLLSTHALPDARALGDKLALLRAGELAAVAPRVDLHSRFGGGYVVACRARDAREAWRHVTSEAPHAIPRVLHACSLHFLLPATYTVAGKEVRSRLSDVFRLVATLQASGHIEDCTVNQSSLEQMFLSVTRQTGGELRPAEELDSVTAL